MVYDDYFYTINNFEKMVPKMLNMKSWSKIIQIFLGVSGNYFIISGRKVENHFTVKYAFSKGVNMFWPVSDF